MSETTPKNYPLLEEILAVRSLPLQAIYTNRDAAKIFDVSVRSIQSWVASASLEARDLPGRFRFLPSDLERFLRNSRKCGK